MKIALGGGGWRWMEVDGGEWKLVKVGEGGWRPMEVDGGRCGGQRPPGRTHSCSSRSSR